MKFYIQKGDKYLSISKKDHHLYFSDYNEEEMVYFNNERQAYNTAYDYGANVVTFNQDLENK